MNDSSVFLNVVNNNKTLTESEKIVLRSGLPRSKNIKKLQGIDKLNQKVSVCHFINLESIKDTYFHSNYLKLPTKQFIIKYFEELNNTYNDNDPRNKIYAFVSYTFKNSNFQKIYVYSEEYEKILDEQVENFIKNNEKYGDNENECKGIIINYKICKFEDIRNWFSEKVSKIIKYKDFTLFTAPDLNINCEQQCVEYFGKKYNKHLSLEDNMKPIPVVTYVPIHNSMNLVILMNDLMSSVNYNTTDCKNVMRIIKFNNHVGLITKINKFKYNKIQHRSAIKIDERKFNEVFVDIESYTDSNGFQKPYLICWSELDGSVTHKEGKDCVTKFVTAIRKHKENVIIYAWYGSGYDFQYILTNMMKHFKIYKYIIKDNKISYAEFITKDRVIILKDPYLFILTSLDKAARSFKVTTKGSFPHQLIKEYNDIYKRPERWPTYSHKVKEIFENGVYNVKLEEITNSIPNNERIIDKAIDYCKTDVIAMKETWIRFKNLLAENLGVTINPKTFTLSQLSMSLMESKLPNHVKLWVPDRTSYDFIKQAIYGGRVIAKNKIYNEAILYADVVSLYPSAMRLLEHGFGKGYKTNKINKDKHGIYKVKLEHKEDKEPPNYMEFVARRIDGKLNWGWFKEHVGYYHTYDLLIAEEEGFNIEVIEGIEYESKGYIFNDYIDTLYKLKEDHSKCDCKEQPCPIRMIAKIALNGGGYGKFVQKPIDKEVYIVEKDVVAGECEKLETDELNNVIIGTSILPKPKFYELDCENYDKMCVEREGDVSYSTQCGVSILSGSRYRLYNLCKNFPGIEIIYSDTDSIYVLKKSVDYDKFNKFCGKELGQLDNELGEPITKMIVGGPKMYGYEYGEEVKLYCKGVPKKMLTMNQFEYLIDSKSNKLMYEFEILIRKLVMVEAKTLIKEIKQT